MRVNIKVDVYGFTVVLVTTFDEYKKLVPDVDEASNFVTISDRLRSYVLVTDAWDDMLDANFLSCLSHEMNHAAMYILNKVDIVTDFEHQESLCYLQDYLMLKSIKAIKRHMRKKLC